MGIRGIVAGVGLGLVLALGVAHAHEASVQGANAAPAERVAQVPVRSTQFRTLWNGFSKLHTRISPAGVFRPGQFEPKGSGQVLEVRFEAAKAKLAHYQAWIQQLEDALFASETDEKLFVALAELKLALTRVGDQLESLEQVMRAQRFWMGSLDQILVDQEQFQLAVVNVQFNRAVQTVRQAVSELSTSDATNASALNPR